MPHTPDHNAQPSRALRLAYLVSHPIQYQAPLLRRIAREPDIDLTVLFGSDFSVRGYKDAGFGGVGIKWDVPLLEGYKYIFLPRLRDGHDVSFAMPINRGIFSTLRGPIYSLQQKPSAPSSRVPHPYAALSRTGGVEPGAPPSRASRAWVGSNTFDALWVHGYASINSLHAILAARLLGIPVLVRAESWLEDRARSPLKLALKNLFFAALSPLVDAVLPIGTLNSKYWHHHLPETPQFLMPYAVDNSYFADRARVAASRRAALQAELGLDPSRPVILFASKLQARKHCDHLISAYSLLSPSPGVEPHPYLLIVGDGDDRGALETQAAASGLRSIRFLGFRNQSELPAFFDLATVFVLPSRHEPWGLIVNEVMNAGIPCIVSSDVGCGPDLITNDVTGFIYPVGDIDALADALRRVLASPETAAVMGRRAFERIQSWSFEEDIRGLRAALASLCPNFTA